MAHSAEGPRTFQGVHRVRKYISAAVLALIVGSGVINTTPAEAAAPKRVVTKAEYRKATKHKSMSKVHRVFDTKGKQSFHFTAIDGQLCAEGEIWACATQTREYQGAGGGFVSVTYYKRSGVWRVESKLAVWF
jgi:hypothetical protein